MNKVDKLVKQMLIGFPTIFRHRFDVMCHLLACNGNGFEWHNGELVCVCSGRGGDKNPRARGWPYRHGPRRNADVERTCGEDV